MRICGEHWIDESGRRLTLRGANLGGDSKLPTRPDGDTRLKEGFYSRKGVSFVGRPFPLEEADGHFARLKRWGLTFHRLLVTWEAVEHDGPGAYDDEYLEYLERLTAKAGERGHSFFVDPHQDAWSRWTGGDGAPIWTLEAAGFEPERLAASGAAHLNQELGSDYPRMTWFSNYDRLACATMWTLFFAGDALAPGIGPLGYDIGSGGGGRGSLQDFLQGRYVAAMAKVAERLAPYANVVGFDSLNEPSAGFIGADSVHRAESLTSLGATPSPWQAILAGSGHPIEVPIFGIKGLARRKVGTLRLGTEGLSAWKEGVECLWRRAGVWDIEGGEPVVRRPAHFAGPEGKGLDFGRDCLLPFMRRFDLGIRASTRGGRRFVLFVEGVPSAGRPAWKAGEPEAPAEPGAVVDATHWYDDLTLITKRYLGFVAYDARRGRPVLGFRRVRRYFIEALRELKQWGEREMAGAPSLLGEFGLPFDLAGGRAYRTGDYRVHERALSAYYDAVDANLLDSTIWNYSAGNRHSGGDLWNTEDLSIFCRDDFESGRTETGEAADAGGRALRGFARPYATAVAGELLEMRFDARRGTFLLRYRPDPAIAAPTEVFAPALQFPRGFSIRTVGCEAEALPDRLLLRAAAGAGEARLLLSRR